MAARMTTTTRIVRRARTAGLALALLVTPAAARGQVSVEVFGGSALNLHTPLTINQTGFPSIEFTAHYSERPFDAIPYYATRLGFWKGSGGWVVELLHHKIYLENPPADVQHFEVSHGYNIVTFNRGWRRNRFVILLGGGLVIAHSNSLIRGRDRSIDEPYTLSGVGVQAAAGRRLDLTPWFFASAEGKVTAAWARVPISGGKATAPNVAFHGLLGIGAQF
jgi:hypothetical protein